MKPAIPLQLCHIQEKIFLGEELLPEEKELLSDFLQQEEIKQELHEMAKDMPPPLSEEVDEIRSFDEFKELHDLQFKADNQEPIRQLPVSNSFTWFYRIAAAILLGVVLKLVIDQFNNKTANSNSEAQTQMETSDLTLLQLSDNKTISLQKRSSNDTILQGNLSAVIDTSGSLFYFYYSGHGIAAGENRIITATASMDSVRLPDGTMVWLDAASTLEIPLSYGTNRVVKISGKGYFDVKPDQHKPFMALLANGDTISVLGTDFNIESYPDSAITTLLSGKVELRTRGKVKELIPGEQAIHKGGDFSVRHVNTEDVLDWKSGYFSNNLKLSALLREFEKFYEVKIVYKDSITDFNVFTIGKLERSKGIDSLMNYLKMSRNLDYTKKGKTYEIRNYNK